jgi:hypothetical protein
VASCLVPLSTIYALTTTTTDKVVATPTTLATRGRENDTSILPDTSFRFKPTTDGFYSISYTAGTPAASRDVGLDPSTGTLVVVRPGTTAYSVEIKYTSVGDTTYTQARVKGNYTYTYTQGLVPTFRPGAVPATNTFVLISQLTKVGDVDIIVPSVVSEDAYTSPSSLPPPYALTRWSVVGVVSGQVVAYPLSEVCADNMAPSPPAPTPWYNWLWLIAAIILIVIAISLAFLLRRKEYVHDPRLIALAATSMVR